MGTRLKSCFTLISVFYYFVWICGIISVLAFKVYDIDNGTIGFAFVSNWFKFSMLGVVLFPIEPVLFVLVLCMEFRQHMSISIIGRTIALFMIYLVLWLLYLCLYMYWTGV